MNSGTVPGKRERLITLLVPIEFNSLGLADSAMIRYETREYSRRNQQERQYIIGVRNFSSIEMTKTELREKFFIRFSFRSREIKLLVSKRNSHL